MSPSSDAHRIRAHLEENFEQVVVSSRGELTTVVRRRNAAGQL